MRREVLHVRESMTGRDLQSDETQHILREITVDMTTLGPWSQPVPADRSSSATTASPTGPGRRGMLPALAARESTVQGGTGSRPRRPAPLR